MLCVLAVSICILIDLPIEFGPAPALYGLSMGMTGCWIAHSAPAPILIDFYDSDCLILILIQLANDFLLFHKV